MIRWAWDDYGPTGLGIGACVLALIIAVVAAILIWGGEDDPCQYVITTGKVTIVGEYDGWRSYGGRDVWCGPGPNPGRTPR